MPKVGFKHSAESKAKMSVAHRLDISDEERLERQRGSVRRWHRDHLEQIRVLDRERHTRDRVKRNAASRVRGRQWYLKNKDRNATRSTDWAKAHPEESRAAVRKYRKKQYALGFRADLVYRARQMNAEGTHTPAEWRSKCAEFDGRCAYCGESKPLARDHDIPLIRGGSDYISNIVPACKSCNSRKGRLTGEEFRAKRMLV